MTIRTESSSTRVTTEPMVGRATAVPPDREFRAALRDGASVLLGGVEAAARSLPGGEIVAAAVHGTVSAGSGAGSRTSPTAAASSAGASVSGVGPGDLVAGGALDQMELIELQQRIQDENRRYSTLSNVLKARHETAKNAIGNIR